jgi:hypothetical protein
LSEFQKLADPDNPRENRYEEAILILSNKEQNNKARKAAKQEAKDYYSVVGSSCLDVVGKHTAKYPSAAINSDR